MSIHTDCREAMERLAANGKTFTEFDIANEASGQGTKGWSGKMFQQAVKDAYTVLQSAYKRGKLARYGPVDYKGHDDYVRRGTKIVYADAEHGPARFETPNGTFPRLLATEDTMLKVGRKPGTNRDDTKPWDDQMSNGTPIDTGPLEKRIRELEIENAKLKAQAEADCKEPEAAPAVLTDAHEALLTELIERLGNGVAEQVKVKIAEALIS